MEPIQNEERIIPMMAEMQAITIELKAAKKAAEDASDARSKAYQVLHERIDQNPDYKAWDAAIEVTDAACSAVKALQSKFEAMMANFEGGEAE